MSGHRGPVIYIADAGNRLERKLLRGCLGRWKAESDGPAEPVYLSLSRSRELPALTGLAQALKTPGNPLLVPVRIAWRMPGVEHERNKPLALRHLVFGDPRRPGAVRGRWILRRDPERAECIAAKPATAEALERRFNEQQQRAAGDSGEDFTAFVARQASVALDIAEWDLFGRRYKAPRFIAGSLQSSPKFRRDLEALSAESGRPMDELGREAAGYMKEVIPECSALFIDFRARFENWVMSLSYNGEIEHRAEDLERMRDIVRSHPTMFLFTHKTYIDSIALTSTLFQKDFPMLHVFAGINMSFAGLGYLMRRSGGIFIRRKFQDKPLYKIVLRHYIGYLMEKRFPLTWAFEGTRSRTGKLMPPRYGLLKYVLEAAHATDARKLHIVPVTVSYDLMRDVQDYASEQTGKAKKPESLKWFIGYLSSLRRPMGRIYLDFGDPVVVPHAPEPDDRMALPKIAFEVAVHANRVTPITLPAVGCMVLLGAAPRALTLREIQAEIIAIARWSHARGIRLTSDFSSERLSHVRRLTDAMVDSRLLIRYDEGSETVFGIEPGQHPLATYYRNTIIHHFVNKAILELALIGSAEAAHPSEEAFWKETLRLRDYFKFEFFYPSKKKFRNQLRLELERVDPQWAQVMGADPAAARSLLDRMHPLFAHASLLPYVEAYSVVFDLLARLGPGDSLEEEELIPRALKQAKQSYLQRRITSEASIGKILFQNGFKLARNLRLTAPGDERVVEGRVRLLREFKELSRRLERIRLIALSSHGDHDATA
jgi:glycerol-3-phosphate O-acyltransferase